jgi:AbrB family looped-hinge helix DNA binding protein
VAISARISKSGQVTIPAEIRQKLGVKSGDSVLWRLEKDGSVRVTPVRFTLEDMDGILGPIPEDMTLDDLIAEATDDAIDRRFRWFREQES